MEKMMMFMIILVSFAASTFAQDGSTVFGSAGFNTALMTTAPFCLIGYDPKKTNFVLANNDAWENGAACGKLIFITCVDPQCTASPTAGSYAVIISLCNGCGPSLTFTNVDAFNSIAPGVSDGVKIQYTYVSPAGQAISHT